MKDQDPLKGRKIPPVKFPKPIKPLKPVTAEMILRGIHEGREDDVACPPPPESTDENK